LVSDFRLHVRSELASGSHRHNQTLGVSGR
jgi:hypothetical protein